MVSFDEVAGQVGDLGCWAQSHDHALLLVEQDASVVDERIVDCELQEGFEVVQGPSAVVPVPAIDAEGEGLVCCRIQRPVVRFPVRPCFRGCSYGAGDDGVKGEGGVHCGEIGCDLAVGEDVVGVCAGQLGERGDAVDSPETLDAIEALPQLVLLSQRCLYGLQHCDEGFVESAQWVFWRVLGLVSLPLLSGGWCWAANSADESEALFGGLPDPVVVCFAAAALETQRLLKAVQRCLTSS